MTTIGGYDAAFPPASPPAGDQVVLGYGGGDTPNVWPLAEWNSQKARYRIPIWTRSNPAGRDGAAEAAQFLAYLDSVGAPRGILTVLDYETAIDAAFVTAFDRAMVAGGNKVALYGSTSTLFQNPRPSGGYFPADLTGQPHLYPGTLITQYRFESAWDDDTVSASAVLWDTQAGSAPPPVPDPSYYLLESSMLPQIESLASDTRSAGSKGQYAYGMGALYDQGSITFSADGGLNGNQTAAALRVVCWNASGYHISNVVVGYPEANRAQVMFPTDSPVYAVTVLRTDDGDFPVAVAVP